MVKDNPGSLFRERIFLVAGLNFYQRKSAVDSIKKNITKGRPGSFDTHIIYSDQVTLSRLQEELLTFSFAKEKVVILKNAHKLPKDIRDYLLESIIKILTRTYVILETEKEYAALRRDKRIAKDNFFDFVFHKSRVFRLAHRAAPTATIDDFRLHLRRNDFAAAFYILDSLLVSPAKSKELGPLILGILVSKVVYSNRPIDKKRCLKHLWEADRAMKESGLDSRLALERLLVKIFDY